MKTKKNLFFRSWLSLSLVVTFGLLSMLVSASVAQEPSNHWTEFRGIGGMGTVSGIVFPSAIAATDIEWETKIHGKGWSSPVVFDDQIWLTTATDDGKEMSVLCVSLSSGEVLLDRVIHKNDDPDFCHPTNSYASPTPAIEAGRVYLHFGKYGTTCLDTKTFKTIWQRIDFECDHFRGPGSSPILFEDLLLVAFDGADQQYVAAMNKANGKTVWKRQREIDFGTDNGDHKKSYGTGSVVDVDGEAMFICPAAVATVAYRVKTGEPVWTVYHGGMNASARPLMTPEGTVLVTNGMGMMVAIDPAGKGDITQSNIKWKLTKSVSKKPSPLVIGNRFYMISDKGVAGCFKTENGEMVWQERVGGAFSSSPVFDGESIFVCSEQGDVISFAAEDEYRSLGKTKIGDGFKATAAIAGERMILRSFSKLYSVKGKKK